jgi:hypothetical protein
MLLKKNTYLRNHVCAFAEQLSNALNRRMLEHILNPGSHADRAAPDAHSLSA